MYFQISNAIETQLAAETSQRAEMYNAQYDGTIIPQQILFVEFIDPGEAQQISKSDETERIRVRIHSVTKVLADASGKIMVQDKLTNDTLSAGVKTALKNFRPMKDGTPLTTPLKYKGRKPWQRYKGYLVMFVEFEAKLL